MDFAAALAATAFSFGIFHLNRPRIASLLVVLVWLFTMWNSIPGPTLEKLLESLAFFVAFVCYTFLRDHRE